ncbi:MAG: hypothetical protein IJA47_04550 [Oscillospiraceae bacterium]|nr:hypothetical protein [Oscillospiraceae bacterium]
MRKRVLSLLLAICLVVGLLPPTALAEGSDPSGGTPPVENPTPVTLEMFFGNSQPTKDPEGNILTEPSHLKVTANANDVLYFTTSTDGTVVTNITSTYVDDTTTPWQIKLDNTKTVAELTLKTAKVVATNTSGNNAYIETPDGSVRATPMKVTGEGALKMIVDGENYFKAGYSNCLVLGMTGKTTITSTNGGILTAIANGTGIMCGISSTGELALENVNVTTSNKVNNNSAAGAIQVGGNLTVKGGSLSATGNHRGSHGIVVSGTLHITDGAKVTATKAGTADTTRARYGVQATAIDFDSGSLEIKDTANGWAQAITVMPDTSTIVSPDSLIAKYSVNGDGTEAQDIDLNDAAALTANTVNYVYFKSVCGENNHAYTDATDPDCNKCGGGIREVPKDITVTLTNVATWNAKPGEIYYATTTDQGVVTDLGTVAPADDNWNIKLDNTQAVAELTLKNAVITTTASSTSALKVSGTGALKVNVDGTSTMSAKSATTFTSAMDGGLIITSTNDGTLNMTCTYTSATFALRATGTGEVLIKDANVIAKANTKRNDSTLGRVVYIDGSLTVDGGSLNALTTNSGMNAIHVVGTLTAKNFARVSAGTTYAGQFINGSNVPATSSRVRYGIYAGDIVIDTATVSVIDSNVTTTTSSNDPNFVFTGSFEQAFNVVPTVTNGVGKYSESHQGTSAQEFDVTDAVAVTAILGQPYVVIEAVCPGHTYNDGTYDYECDLCGYIRYDVPRDITVHVVTDGGAKLTSPLTPEYDRNVVVPAGETYYGIANGDGLVTDFKKFDTEPDDWDFMVDNTHFEARLVFNNAKLTNTGAENKGADGLALSLLTVSGDGALRIIARGESTLTSLNSYVIHTAMAGGTTYTSENGGKLTANKSGTPLGTAVAETVGNLTLDNANLRVLNRAQNKNWPSIILSAAKDMQIIGGKLELVATNYTSRCLNVGGNLTLNNYAIVTIKQTSDSTEVFTGVTDRPNDPQYRYGVFVNGEFNIDDASLYVIDNAKNMFEYSVNKLPTVSGNTKSYYSANVDGSELQTLTDQNTIALNKGPAAAVEFPYVAFIYDCAGQHTYDGANDPECNKCGEIREVPRDLVVTFNNFVKDTIDQQIVWTAAPGQVYYATTNDKGVITDLATTAPADGSWNIKLDNSKPVAELTLRNATLVRAGGTGSHVISAVGEGALKIITEGNSSVTTSAKPAVSTSMVGGTTYTSIDNAKLTVKQTGTNSTSVIVESAGNLTFDHANLYVTHNSENTQWPSNIISAAKDMKVIGGKLDLVATNYSIRAIHVGGNLALEDYALVTIKQTSTSSKEFIGVTNRPTREEYRYGVYVKGEFTVDGANLYITDNAKNMFEYAISKIPTMTDAKAYYSESLEGTNLQALTAQNTVSLSNGPTAAVEFPYVAIVYDCIGINGAHTYDPNNPDGDADCELCGFVRDVPRDVTLTIRTDGGDTAKTETEVVHTVTVKAKEVYYFVADDKGFVTNVTTTEPESWDIMLDNRNPVAQLVFDHDAYLYKKGSHGGSILSVSGEGALKIVVNSNAKIKSGSQNMIVTGMGKGTTYTSVGDAKLTVDQDSTGLSNVITESKGNLIFDHANLYVTHKSENNQWPSTIIYAGGNMKVIGGQLDLIATNYSIRAIYTEGNLSLDDYAIVNIKQNSTSSKEFVGVTGRPDREQYRYGVHAKGEFTINNSSLYITDNARNMFEYALNKFPVVNGSIKAYYSTSTDGSDLQTLTSANTTTLNSVSTPVVEFPYVAFAYDCGGQHAYTNDTDPTCNKCGEVRIVPYPITLTITNIVSKVLPDGKQIVWNAAIGQIYYATTDKQGIVTDLGTTAPADGNWNIKLDNTKPTAELTFKNATVKMDGAQGLARSNNAISIVGEGTLKVIFDGVNNFSTGYRSVLATAMNGGTTYTSVNGGKLTTTQNGTSGYSAITETAGNLTFENANIYASGKRQGKYMGTIVNGAADVIISGGSIEIESINCSNHGLVAGGNLKLINWAKVRMVAKRTNVTDYAGAQGDRHAVKANGVITIDNSSLRIIDSIGIWDVAINKSPKLIGTTAKYSEVGEGKNLQALNPADPAAAVEYPYVEYLVDCAEHIYDNDRDPECNRCGEIRAVPYDIQVAFQFGTVSLAIVAWDAKVGEVYYAKTNANGQVIDLGKKDSEPAEWNIKLDNTGIEAVLTFKDAKITRTVKPTANDMVFDMAAGSFGGTVGAQGNGALRIVCEKASTITTENSSIEILTTMNGGTTYTSKDNAKLTFTTSKTSVSTGIREAAGNLTFDHANVYVKMKRTSKNWNSNTVSTPLNMTVIGGKVEIVASAYATNGLSVGGDLLVKENGILIITTGTGAASGTCTRRPSGITVAGDITVDNATLMIKNNYKYWQYLINKMPILVNAGSYRSETSTKESKLEAFTLEAGADMSTIEAMKFFYFSNAKPGTLDDSAMEEEEEENDDSFFFDDLDNPFTGDTVNLTLLFVLTMTSAAGLVVLFSKKRIFRE